LAAEVERDVDAEAGLDGYRVDEVARDAGVARREPEVVALAQVLLPAERADVEPGQPRDRRRPEPGRVHDEARRGRRARARRGPRLAAPAAAGGLDRDEGVVEPEQRPGGPGLGGVALGQRVRVDDAGLGRQQTRDGADARLQPCDLVALEQPELARAILQSL